MEQVDWVPALAVLAVGAIAGAIVVWRAGRGGRRADADAVLDVRDLRAQLDALVGQLRELNEVPSSRSSEDIEKERMDLEVAAARTLRDLENATRAAPVAAAAAEAVPEESGGSTAKGFAWGAGSVLAIALLVVLVARTATDREPAAAPGPVDPADIAALRQRVEADPGNLEARLDLARSLLVAGDLQGAASEIGLVLSREPEHPRALSYSSLIRLAQGDLAGAAAAAERAIALDPSNPEPRVHLAIVLAQSGDRQGAARVLEEAASLFPADAAALERLAQEILGEPAVASNLVVDVSLGPGVSAGAGTLFVIVRPIEGGEPVAVRREAVAEFPARIEITPADLMSGNALPPELVVEARLDADGSLSTRSPEDLEGSAPAQRGVARVVLGEGSS